MNLIKTSYGWLDITTSIEYVTENEYYAEHNQKPSEDIENYVYKKWLPYANRQLKR